MASPDLPYPSLPSPTPPTSAREPNRTFSYPRKKKIGLGEWFRNPRTCGLSFRSAGMIYAGFTTAGALMMLLSRLKSSDELVSLDVTLLSAVIVTGMLALVGLERERKPFIPPFFIAVALFTLFFVAFWLTQVIASWKNARNDILALFFILYIVGHGYRVILAAFKEMRVEDKEEKYEKF